MQVWYHRMLKKCNHLHMYSFALSCSNIDTSKTSISKNNKYIKHWNAYRICD